MIILSYSFSSHLYRLPVMTKESPSFLYMLRKGPSIRVEWLVRRIYRTLREPGEGFLNSHAGIQGFS